MAKQLTLPNTGKHPDGLTEQERAETLVMLEREAEIFALHTAIMGLYRRK